MDVKNLIAIDVHTHAEVSSRIPDDPRWQAIQEASARYFKDKGPRPTITEIAAYYRERKMACVIFPVDMESTTGLARVPNEEAGEVPKAFVVLRAGYEQQDRDELMAWINGQLATYKHVHEIEFIEAIPRNPSGKILRRILREQERRKMGLS